VLTAVGLPVGHAYMSFVDSTWRDEPLTVCRTGYTGEHGYELVVPVAGAASLWDALLAAGEPYDIRPCGLGARDTLRTEMGYPLHGQDISLDVTPVQGRIGWAVGWKKPAFWGREVLVAEREAGPKRRLTGLEAAGRGIPRPGMQVLDEAGSPVGTVTSGTFSPTRRIGVGLALLDAGVAEGATLTVDVRGRQEQFTVKKPPFVDVSPKA
jgi:aminomethyltransferase